GQGDDALAAARSTGDHDDRLGVLVPGPLYCVQYQLVGDPLLVQQSEMFALRQGRRGVGEQVSARPDRACQEPVRRVDAGLGRQDAAEVLDELAATLPSEQPALLSHRLREQVTYIVVGGVVQVRRTADE